MRCKIVRTQKLMWHNIMSSTKGQKVSVLYYSIDSNVVYSVSAPISVWSLEWNISVPINTSVPFRVYRKYIYIYILIYSSIHLFIKIYNLLVRNLSNYKHISILILIIIISLHLYFE